MPKKEHPEFKSWKKLERYCKKTGTKCYLTDVESGANCRHCYVKINWKWKNRNKSPRSPRNSFFANGGYRHPTCLPPSRGKVLCRQCYDKKFAWDRIGLIIMLLVVILVVLFLLLTVFVKIPKVC